MGRGALVVNLVGATLLPRNAQWQELILDGALEVTLDGVMTFN